MAIPERQFSRSRVLAASLFLAACTAGEPGPTPKAARAQTSAQPSNAPPTSKATAATGVSAPGSDPASAASPAPSASSAATEVDDERAVSEGGIANADLARPDYQPSQGKVARI